MPRPGDVEISGVVLEQQQRRQRERQQGPGASPALRHEARPGSAPRLGAQPLTRAATTGRQAVFRSHMTIWRPLHLCGRAKLWY